MNAIDLDSPGGYAKLVRRVTALGGSTSQARVVALDGRSGVGKSTLAARLAGATGATVIDGDGFYAGGIEVRRDSPVRRVAECIDWRRQRDVLMALREGGSVGYHAFDWDAFDGRREAEVTTIAPASVFILEGVYSARSELADLLDLRVLLRVPDDVRMRRLDAREGGIGEWERAWHDAESWYFANQMPESSFDVVVRQGADR